MKLILKLLFNTGVIFSIAYYMPSVTISDLTTGLIVSVVYGLVNTFIRPILKLLTLPISIITLGLFGIVINAFLTWLVVLIVPGFGINGFLNYFIFTIVLSILTTIIGWFIN